MNLHPDCLYHVYTRGNNQQRVFMSPENYRYFLVKMRAHILPHAHILAWCLMPNHFHWLLQLRAGTRTAQFSAGLRTLLSSYTRAINLQEQRTGSLFQQRTHAKRLDTADYALHCFCYIHQNPLRAALETMPGNWPWSSFRDYAGLRGGNLCDHALATQLLDLPPEPLARQALMLQLLPESATQGLR